MATKIQSREDYDTWRAQRVSDASTLPVMESLPLSETRLALPLASRFSRLAASLIDYFAKVTLALPLFLGDFAFFLEGQETISFTGLVVLLPTLAPAFFFGLLQYYFIAGFGQSLGKWLLNIKIVTGTGSAPGFYRGVWRRIWILRLAGLVGAFLFALMGLKDVGGSLLYLLGLVELSLIFGSTRQCFHDRLANTEVVRCMPESRHRVPGLRVQEPSSPWIAGVLAAVVPGLGHIYLGVPIAALAINLVILIHAQAVVSLVTNLSFLVIELENFFTICWGVSFVSLYLTQIVWAVARAGN